MGVRVAADDLPDELRIVPPDDLPDGLSPRVDVKLDFNPPEEKGFLGGMAETLIPDWESVKTIVKAGGGNPRAAMDLLKGIFGAHKEQFVKAGEAFGQGENLEGVGRVAAGMLPLAGPAAATAGERIGQGEVARGLGNAAGLLAPFGAGKALEGVGAGARLAGKGLKRVVGSPEEIYQSALKPSTTFSLEKRARILKTGIDERIPVNQKGLTKARNVIEQIKSEVDARIAAATAESNPSVPTAAIAERIEQVKPRFQTVAPESDINALESLKQQFLDKYGESIPIAEAQKVKQNTYRQLKDKAYGEQKTAATEGEKALARGLKEELEKIVPELKALNQREGSVIALEKSLTRAVGRINNHQMFGIGTPAMGALGYAVGGAPGAAALAVLKLVLDNPTVKSNLSFALSRAKSLRAKPVLSHNLGRGIPPNEPPTTPTPAAPIAPAGGGRPGGNAGTGTGDQGFRGSGIQEPLPEQAPPRAPATAAEQVTAKRVNKGSIRQVDPIREEALDIVHALSMSYGGKGGLPVKTKALIYKDYIEGPSGILEGTGPARRVYEGINVDDIPVLQDVPHSKSAIENALKKRSGKVWNNIVKAAEDYVRRYKDEEARAAELGDDLPF